VIERLRQYFDELGQPLVARWPNLYLLRVHIVFPLAVVFTLFAAIAGKLQRVSLDAVPKPQLRLLIGLLVGLVILCTWGFLVVRDLQRFLPERGLRSLGLFCVAALAACCIAAPAIVYSRLQTANVFEFAEAPNVRKLTEDYSSLETEFRALVVSSPDQRPRGALSAYLDHLKDFSNALAELPGADMTPACFEEALPRLLYPEDLLRRCFGEHVSVGFDSLSSRWRRSAGTDDDLASAERLCTTLAMIGIGWAGVVVAILITAAATSLVIALSLTGGLGAYVFLAVFLIDFLHLENADGVMGTCILAHWGAFALAAYVFWVRRASGWTSRIVGSVLALQTPFLVFGWILTVNIWGRDKDLPAFVLTSYLVYLLLFPFTYGNLARLRVLPRP
jgi:hypothetical protein